MSQLATAFEMYYNDNGFYPDCSYGNSGDENSKWYTCLGPALSPYMSKMPSDPLDKGDGYLYIPSVNNYGQGLRIFFYIENSNPNYSNAQFSGAYRNIYGYRYFTEIGDY